MCLCVCERLYVCACTCVLVDLQFPVACLRFNYTFYFFNSQLLLATRQPYSIFFLIVFTHLIVKVGTSQMGYSLISTTSKVGSLVWV